MDLLLVLIGAVILFLLLRTKRLFGSKKLRIRQNYPFNSETATTEQSTELLRGYARIVDGDTSVVRKKQIRLYGIDAPEINHPFGQKAKWALVSLCKKQIVTATILATDDHGRAVARCRHPDGQDLSAAMVKLGLAIDWAKFSGGEYRSLETDDARKKLWLADARQKGRMHVWEKFEAEQSNKKSS
jgi:micrococcal nuclease